MYTSEVSSGKISAKSINVPRNKFNKSHARFFELPMGLIAPFHVERILPNDTIDTSYDLHIELRNPLKKPIANNIRFYLKTYFARDIDLWEGALRYHDKGIRQDQALEMPKLLPYFVNGNNTSNGDPWATTVPSNQNRFLSAVPLSPWDYMGLPWIGYNTKYGYDNTKTRETKRPTLNTWIVDGKEVDTMIKNFYYKNEVETPTEVNALPFVMYVKIKRKDHVNSNLLLKNKYWFPDQDDKFRLPYNCNGLNYKGYNDTESNFKETKNYVNVLHYESPLIRGMNKDWDKETLDERYNIPRNDSGFYGSVPKLNVSYYANWRNDYYTGASPFADLIRNGTSLPTISLNSHFEVNEGVEAATSEYDKTIGIRNESQGGRVNSYIVSNMTGTSKAKGEAFADAMNWALKINSTNLNVKELRNALAKTLICERIGLIENHDFYNGYMNTIYGANVNGECHDPIYLGGGYADMNQSIVENTTAPSSTEMLPLGYIGANATIDGHINGGVFTSNDFGWYMATMYAIPDTIYNGGIEKEWNKLTQETDYNPLMQGTNPQAIEKRTLGMPSTANGWEAIKQAWGYQKRDEEYKKSYNKITGYGACRDSTKFVLDQAYFIKREFTTETAILNEANIECTPDNCKSLAWADQTEPEFRVQIKCNTFITREMMKSAEPSNMGMFN